MKRFHYVCIAGVLLAFSGIVSAQPLPGNVTSGVEALLTGLVTAGDNFVHGEVGGAAHAVGGGVRGLLRGISQNTPLHPLGEIGANFVPQGVALGEPGYNLVGKLLGNSGLLGKFQTARSLLDSGAASGFPALIGSVISGDLVAGGIPVVGTLRGSLLSGIPIAGGVLGTGLMTGGGQGLPLSQIPLSLTDLSPSAALALLNGAALPGL